MPREFEESKEFELCPEGAHLATLKRITDKKINTTNGQRTKWLFAFETDDLFRDADAEPHTLFMELWPNKRDFLKAWDPQGIWIAEQADQPGFDIDDLILQHFLIRVVHAKYTAKSGDQATKAEIVGVYPADSVAPAPVAAAPSTTAPAPQPAYAQPTPAPDDVPDGSLGDPFSDE